MPHAPQGRAAVVLAAFLYAAVPARSMAADGMASWYGGGEKLNRRTATGEIFRPDGFTCAHRTHAFGTKLKITLLSNGRSAVCRVNDRGPAKRTGRIIDLSRGMAAKLGILRSGVAHVRIQVVH